MSEPERPDNAYEVVVDFALTLRKLGLSGKEAHETISNILRDEMKRRIAIKENEANEHSTGHD